jgi:DNA adenine methylase
MTKEYKIKPLFKYIGGKTWLRENLRSQLKELLSKKQYKGYSEPFSGGLGAFLNIYDLLLENNIKELHLNDVSKELIKVYETIYLQKEALIIHCKEIELQYNETLPSIINKETLKEDLKKAEVFFNEQKKRFNILKQEKNITIECAATLVFLQRHSFNGIYRENSKGLYNTPFNWSSSKSNVEDLKKRINEIYEVFSKFNKVEFTALSFEKINYHENYFYYLDPPYLNEEIGENKYHKEHFNKHQQVKLIDSISSYDFLYSNHYSEFLLDEFKKRNSINVETIVRKNNISANASTRDKENLEILVSKR